jgi:hypothetical protein
MVMAFTYSVVWRTCAQPEYCGVGTEHWNYDFYWRPNAMFICLRRLDTSGGTMKKLVLIASACAMSMAASDQARADYSVIRWTSGFCQIWNNSTPWKPFPSDYKRGRVQFQTFGAAMAAKMHLVARRECW